MTYLKIKNRAKSTLASGISATDTTLTVATGEGAKFPSSGPFHVTIDDEILEVTSVSGDTFTVTRGAEGTTPAAHSAGASVELRITAEVIESRSTWTSGKLLLGAGYGNPPIEVDTDASLITSGRFPMARMPDGTSGYVLTFQGIGVDPIAAPAPAPSGNAILAKLQKHLGVWWFGDHWLPAGIVENAVSGSGNISWYSGHVTLSSGTTSLSYVTIYKTGYGLSEGYSWDKKRYFGLYVQIYAYSNQYIHLVSGEVSSLSSNVNTYHHIGFKLIDANLYGTVANGTTESTLLLETLTASVFRRLECVLTPGAECRFYVNGVNKGAITSNLPTGLSYSNRLFRASVYNTAAELKYINLYSARTFMEE